MDTHRAPYFPSPWSSTARWSPTTVCPSSSQQATFLAWSALLFLYVQSHLPIVWVSAKVLSPRRPFPIPGPLGTPPPTLLFTIETFFCFCTNCLVLIIYLLFKKTVIFFSTLKISICSANDGNFWKHNRPESRKEVIQKQLNAGILPSSHFLLI